MPNQPSVNKRHVTIRVNVETARAVVKKYGRKEDTNATIPFIRALEDATRDVELSVEDYQLIADEARLNAEKLKRYHNV